MTLAQSPPTLAHPGDSKFTYVFVFTSGDLESWPMYPLFPLGPSVGLQGNLTPPFPAPNPHAFVVLYVHFNTSRAPLGVRWPPRPSLGSSAQLSPIVSQPSSVGSSQPQKQARAPRCPGTKCESIRRWLWGGVSPPKKRTNNPPNPRSHSG